ncbi:MAG TPA: hypothetical protein PLS29_03805 [Acidimicrobiales bacterium]|nr:MAG: hypothetical protein B7Z69_05270 [Actinobacteria bacterium 21-73-9]HQU26138.1 hypothetical protein [Acidimicrobiales bacterium]
MSLVVAELLDYDRLRATQVATVIVRSTSVALVVLGSAQATESLDLAALGAAAVRRRRGGGGVVLLGRGDLWVDWWVPTGDPRWSPDVHATAVAVGDRWAGVLGSHRDAPVEVHRGRLVDDPTRPGVCFAGRGPGEVFVGGLKAVGVTQWRVREGAFVSTVLPASPQARLAPAFAGTSGAFASLAHATVATLGLEGAVEAVLEELTRVDGPWRVERPAPLA